MLLFYQRWLHHHRQFELLWIPLLSPSGSQFCEKKKIIFCSFLFSVSYNCAEITSALLRNTGPGFWPSYLITPSSVPWKCAYWNKSFNRYIKRYCEFYSVMETSKSAAKAGTTGVSKLLGLPWEADTENFQNCPSWYWGPMREETMGKALTNTLLRCAPYLMCLCSCHLLKGLSAPVLIRSW